MVDVNMSTSNSCNAGVSPCKDVYIKETLPLSNSYDYTEWEVQFQNTDLLSMCRIARAYDIAIMKNISNINNITYVKENCIFILKYT